MFNDDDFFINDDELAEDNQLDLVDSAKMDLLTSIKKAADDMIGNLKFNEHSEADNNTKLICSYVDHLISLSQINVENLSDEEIYEKIDEIMRSTTELTFGNMKDVLPEEEQSENIASAPETDDGIDW